MEELTSLGTVKAFCIREKYQVGNKIAKSAAGNPTLLLKRGSESLRIVLSKQVGEKYPIGSKMDKSFLESFLVQKREKGLIITLKETKYFDINDFLDEDLDFENKDLRNYTDEGN